MTYQVIKTVKGKRYLYSQFSYRENGKVKTKSQYIGAVDSDGVILSDHEERKAIGIDTREKINQTLTERQDSKSKPKKTIPKANKELSLQKPTFNLKSIVKISKSALVAEYNRVANKLKRYEVSPAKFPKITVKHGSETKHYKPAFRDGLIVTIPPKKGTREKLRKEYRKALHRGFIETLEQEAPEKISPFLYAFDNAYRTTQNALNNYLWNCNSSGSFARVFALKFFSVINPISTGKYSKLPAHKLGIIEYGKRKDWKTDYCEIMAEINRKGLDALYSQASREVNIANKAQRKAIKTKTIFFIRRRKKVKRLQARIDANKALLRKLDLLKQFKLL